MGGQALSASGGCWSASILGSHKGGWVEAGVDLRSGGIVDEELQQWLQGLQFHIRV